jgi:hypothetical protein
VIFTLLKALVFSVQVSDFGVVGCFLSADGCALK